MFVLTLRYGPVGLGLAFLLSLVVNNTTELVVLYRRDGLLPFSREQLYAGLLTIPCILALLAAKRTAGVDSGALVAVFVVGGYVWLAGRFLLREPDRAAVSAWLW